VHGSLEIAATCCAALVRRARDLAEREVSGVEKEQVSGAGTPAARPRSAPLATWTASRAGWLSEVETRTLVEAHGVPVVGGTHCRTEDEARTAAAAGPGPWAVKAVSAALPHKTEADAVRLGLATPDEVAEAFRACVAGAEAVAPGAVEGALVVEMLPPPLAELLVGARRDPTFGPILTIGFGGTGVELDPDVAIRLLPAEPIEVEAMIDGLRKAALLRGHRGRPAIHVSGLGRAALGVAETLLADPTLAEVELNPVFCYADRAIAVDATARRAESDPGDVSAESP